MGFIGNTDLLLRHDRPVDEILDAMETLRTVSIPMHWLVVGGPDAMAIQDLASARGLGSYVRCYTSMPYDQLAPFYSVLDLGLNALSDIPSFNLSLGNKVFDYMARGIPLLVPAHAVDCTALVRREYCGWVYHPTMLMPMLELIAHAPKDRKRRGDNGRAAFLRDYCWEVQAPRFVEICESYT
jgi:glycosyltransferase involved in cell wall biosynthesis